MKRVACLIGLLLLASPLAAQEPVQEEQEHVVRRGDTLWDLASYYFSNPFEWPTIFQANTTVVEDPHWIYPEEVLVIPGISGDTEPMTRTERTERAAEPRVAVRQPERPVRTVFYRQPPAPPADQVEDPTVLSEPAMERVPVRSGEFNAAPWVGDPDALDIRGQYIAALRENRDVGGAPSAHPQDEVFLGYAGDDRPAVDDRLLLIRIGEGLAGGRVLTPTGVVRVTRVDDQVMFGRIEAQYAPVHRGHVAITMPMYPDFMVEEAQPVETRSGYDIETRVIRFLGDPPLPKRGDMAFIEAGAGDGVNVGDVFTAYLPERAAREREIGDFLSRVERLPTENVAHLRVVRVGEDVATVKVDQLMLPRLEDGIRIRRTRTVQ